jgi:hypothetical protein
MLAMIVGRVLFLGSKRSLVHRSHTAALWELFVFPGRVDVEVVKQGLSLVTSLFVYGSGGRAERGPAR